MRRGGPDNLTLSVAEKIHALRTEQGGSVTVLAHAADIHRGHLMHVECGFVSPNARTLAAIGGALGVRPSDLLNVDLSDDRAAIYDELRTLPDEYVTALRNRLESRRQRID